MASIAKQVEELLMSWPGKRGIDIPEHEHDTIVRHASAKTLPIWGRYPTPEHIAGFHAAGAHENPEIIHQFYDSQPHPHADGMTVGEYHGWHAARKVWKEHGGD